MPPQKRTSSTANGNAASEPVAKRRSSRQAAAAATVKKEEDQPKEVQKTEPKTKETKPAKNQAAKVKTETKKEAQTNAKKPANPKNNKVDKPETKTEEDAERASSEDQNVDDIPTVNPEAPRHDGEWYWLMKAEPETRLENGHDVRFSIDDLRAKKKPEGWDGIRAYAARNHMRNMNAGDKAFFYHSNCKEPGIVGIMEIVKEFSEDTSARQPGTPYYDPKSTKDNPRWSLVHVEFRKKFAVPITLKELRELGDKGGPLADMQMLKQSRLSVSRVSEGEWRALCELADRKAKEAGLEHEEGKL